MDAAPTCGQHQRAAGTGMRPAPTCGWHPPGGNMMKLRCPLRSSWICSSLGSKAKQRTVKASGKALRSKGQPGPLPCLSCRGWQPSPASTSCSGTVECPACAAEHPPTSAAQGP